MKYIFTLAILVCSFVSYSQKAGSGYIPVGYVDGKNNYWVTQKNDHGLFSIRFKDAKEYVVRYADSDKDHYGKYVIQAGKLILTSEDGVKREFKVIPIDGNAFKMEVGSKTVYFFRITE